MAVVVTNLWWKVHRIWQSSSFILHLFRNGGSSLQWFVLAPSMGLHTQSGLAHCGELHALTVGLHIEKDLVYIHNWTYFFKSQVCFVLSVPSRFYVFLPAVCLPHSNFLSLLETSVVYYFLKVCLTCYSVKHWLLKWVVFNHLYFQFSPLRGVVNFEHVGKRMLLLKVLWSPIE